MNKKYNFSLLCYDIIFKTIFGNNPNILAKMISNITQIPYSLLKDNLILETNELPISKTNEKAKRCDFIVRLDKNTIINIELNRQSHTGLIVKNLSYIFKIFSTNFSKGKEYNKNFQVMQINLNCFKENNLKPLTKYYLKEETDNSIYTKNLIIYSLNVVNCYEVYYNKNVKNKPSYINWGALIYSSNLQEIDEIGKQILTNEERNIFMEELKKVTKNELFMSDAEALRLAEWEQNTMYNDGIDKGIKTGIEQGIEQGLEQGIEQTTNKTIISLLKKNMPLKDISEVTGKSIKEIEQILKTTN